MQGDPIIDYSQVMTSAEDIEASYEICGDPSSVRGAEFARGGYYDITNGSKQYASKRYQELESTMAKIDADLSDWIVDFDSPNDETTCIWISKEDSPVSLDEIVALVEQIEKIIIDGKRMEFSLVLVGDDDDEDDDDEDEDDDDDDDDEDPKVGPSATSGGASVENAATEAQSLSV